MTEQNKHTGRILIAAPKSGTGKTLLTCGILQALVKRGICCASFKCGPDYIDPMFHREVLQISGSNLDTFFSTEDTVRAIVAKQADKVTIIEGVMGYYDGLGACELTASTYEVASVTETPVILVVDGKNCSLSLVAVIQGFLQYQPNSQIQGVICNRMKKEMYLRLVPKIEELGVKVLGYVPEYSDLQLESRHLGLVLPMEVKTLQARLSEFASRLEETLDFQEILNLAEKAPQLHMAGNEQKAEKQGTNKQRTSKQGMNKHTVRIAVARDEAFCFYYPENLECLQQAGAELIFFSPLHDTCLPERISGLLLGGGYPELYARELSCQRQMREEIYQNYQKQMPIVAECGGFLYLHETLEDTEGNYWPMVGVFSQKAWNQKKLGRFGYITVTAQTDGFLCKGESIKGHEFHYWESSYPGNDMCAKKPIGNRSWECMIQSPRILAGFPHLYYPSNPKLAERFVHACENYAKEQV